ncbi:MAG TPA: S53 family peptidase [Dehalococcoidia bacterium]|nr:S53 family peptidase [Dehalococcoidia bacterium]
MSWHWRRGRILALCAVSLALLSTAAAWRPASAGLQFAPLAEVAPDSDLDLTGAAGPAYACTTPAPVVHSVSFHCYTPSQIFAAYGVDALHAEGTTGKGQTIVIVDSYGSPTAQHDLDVFSDTFGLPRTQIEFIYPDGTPPFNNSVNGSPAGWAFETSLDLQWAHAIAPDAHLVLVAANPAETQGVQGFPGIFKGEQIAVGRFPGAVLSQSFAVTEQSFHAAAAEQVQLLGQVYQRAAANRVTVLGSSGDSGTANGDKQGRVFPFPTVNWPSSDPMVTSAGGTWLQYGWTWNPTSPTSLSFLTTPGSRTEAVWDEPFLPAAGGGGRSVLFSTPAFQSGIAQSLLQGRRGLPDLSWNAAVDGGVLVYTSFPTVRVGWHIVGGTSAASPQLAALVALANQLADAAHKAHVGYLNPLIYQLPAGDFTDIVPQTFGPGAVTLADNAEFGSGIAGMAVTPGYDLATGFGSPKAHSFVHDLANLLP